MISPMRAATSPISSTAEGLVLAELSLSCSAQKPQGAASRGHTLRPQGLMVPEAGLLFFYDPPRFTAMPSPPRSCVQASRTMLQLAQRASEACFWPAAAWLMSPATNAAEAEVAIALLLATVKEQDDAGTIGPVVVRYGQDCAPKVASSRLDALLALAKSAANLFDFLSRPTTQQEGNAATHSHRCAPQELQRAVSVYLKAFKQLSQFSTELVLYAMARIQDRHVLARVRQASDKPSPEAQLQLKRHEQALLWAHRDAIEGPAWASGAPDEACLAWLCWAQKTMNAVENLPSEAMASHVEAQRSHFEIEHI